MKKYTRKQNQSVFDIGIEQYGSSIEGAVQIWRDNKSANVFANDLEDGQEIKINLQKVFEQSVRDYFAVNDRIVATNKDIYNPVGVSELAIVDEDNAPIVDENGNEIYSQ